MVKVPSLAHRARLPDAERYRIGEQLLTEYNDGKSIRQLCTQTGYSIGRMRRLLLIAGVEFRRRGGSMKR